MKLTENPGYMEHFREVTYSMMNGVLEMVKHPDGTSEILYANEAAARMLCKDTNTATEQLGDDPYAFVYPLDRDRVREAIESCRTNENVKETYRVIDKDGQVIWVLAHFHTMYEQDDLHIVIIYSNISELMSTQARLSSEGLKLWDIINSIPMGIIIFDIDDNGKCSVVTMNDQLIVFSNNVGKYLDGKSRSWTKEELTMLFNQSLYAFCDRTDVGEVNRMLEESKTEYVTSCIFKLRGSKEPNIIYLKSTCYSKPVSDTSRYYYITFENVTKDKQQEIELAKKQELLMLLSYTDSLTKVMNRNSYNNYVRNCWIEPLSKTGILFADLNGLKRVNDLLGHQYGDEMIVRFANILKKYFDSEIIYRISGDEFISILPNIERKEFMDRMHRLYRELEDNESIASIGYIWEEAISDVKLAVNQAEQLMYIEKQRYYEKENSLNSKHRPLLLNLLLSDLENKRFRMYLQPKGDIDTSKIIGAEALIRKIDDTGRIVAPYDFIPQLEKERLIPKIDYYMLNEVCRFLEKLKRMGKNDFIISVNMSRVTLAEANYIETVEEIISRYNINLEQLEFEITESNETMDNMRLEEYIRKIKSLGIRISLDDVGTEYSSLPMLLLDGIDSVKLDRSLILKAKTIKASRLLKYITDMCHSFGMTVIAEGVEEDAVREGLKDINCDIYQGYLLSKPIPHEDFLDRYLI